MRGALHLWATVVSVICVIYIPEYLSSQIDLIVFVISPAAGKEFLRRAFDMDIIWDVHCDLVKLDRLGDDVVLSSAHQYTLDKSGQPVEIFRKYGILVPVAAQIKSRTFGQNI